MGVVASPPGHDAHSSWPLDTGEDVEPSLLEAKVARFLLHACLCLETRFSAYFCIFAIFVQFLVPFLVPFFGPKIGPRLARFNRKRIDWSKSGPNFESHFWSHFWPPKSTNFWFPVCFRGPNFGTVLGALSKS